jgi:hypothetical protein
MGWEWRAFVEAKEALTLADYLPDYVSHNTLSHASVERRSDVYLIVGDGRIGLKFR